MHLIYFLVFVWSVDKDLSKSSGVVVIVFGLLKHKEVNAVGGSVNW
jgi:hypothetical protein